jgi:hypothetical protein
MLKISGSAASVAAIAAVVLSGVGAGLPIESARADSCVTAPNTAAPEGQHWYYRSDRANHRKCWFLRATERLPHQAIEHPSVASADPQNAALAPASAEPAALPASDAPPPTSQADTAQPQPAQPEPAQPKPHVTVLTVRTVATPFVSATTTPQQSAPESNDAAPTVPQTLPSDENTAGNGIEPAASPPASTEKAPLPPVPAAARHELAKTLDAANAPAPMGPARMFFLLALALGSAAIVIVIASKIASRNRAPRISDDPDAAWIRYRAANQRPDEEASYDDEASYEERGVPFVEPQGQHGLADLDDQEWDDQPAPQQAEYPAARSQERGPAPAEAAAPSLKDIELALRILQQARQSRVA